MPRFHLFEFEDMNWFPQVIRQGMMDYLRHMIEWSAFYKPAAPIIKQTLDQSRESQLLEICAGGGGNVMKMKNYLSAVYCHPKIFLSDLYPNTETYEKLKQKSGGQIDFISASVNALDVPSEIGGMRVMFSALHHFKPQQVKMILEDAEKKKTPVVFFDAGARNWLNIPMIILLQPFTFLFLTPFFKPFRWSNIVFTYLIPLIVICTAWDGCISILRFYTTKELESLTSSASSNDYIWKVGTFKNRMGVKINYVTGIPSNQDFQK